MVATTTTENALLLLLLLLLEWSNILMMVTHTREPPQKTGSRRQGCTTNQHRLLCWCLVRYRRVAKSDGTRESEGQPFWSVLSHYVFLFQFVTRIHDKFLWVYPQGWLCCSKIEIPGNVNGGQV